MARRQQKAVERKVAIVAHCAAVIMNKIDKFSSECKTLEKEIDDLEYNIVRLSDSGASDTEIKMRLIMLNEKKRKYEMRTALIVRYESLYALLLELKIEAEAFKDTDDYEYLLRKFPARKLPKLIKMGTKGIPKITKVITEGHERILDHATLIYGSRIEAEKAIKQIKETASKQLEIYDSGRVHENVATYNFKTPESSVKSDVEAIRKARAEKNGATAPASMTVPVGVDTPATVNGQNKNTK